jgi:hypothetical protein
MSATEMSDTTYTPWCFFERDETTFDVTISPTVSISRLRKIIKEEKSNPLQEVDASSLILWEVCYFMISSDITGDTTLALRIVPVIPF